MRVKTYRPMAMVFFLGKDGIYYAEATRDPNDDLISLNVTKQKGTGGGQFTINLVPKMFRVKRNKEWSATRGLGSNYEGLFSWDEILSANDLVIIKMFRPNHKVLVREQKTWKRDHFIDSTKETTPGFNFHRFRDPYDNHGLYMLGAIDRVFKSFDIKSGKPSRSIVVTGRELGAKFALNTQIHYFPYFNPSDAWAKGLTWLQEGFAANGHPSNVIALAFLNKFLPSIRIAYSSLTSKYLVDENKQLKGSSEIKRAFFPSVYEPENSIELDNLLRFRLGGSPDYKIPYQADLIQYQGNFWTFFQTVANMPWNELFWDTRADHEDVVHGDEVQAATAIADGTEKLTRIKGGYSYTSDGNLAEVNGVTEQIGPYEKYSKVTHPDLFNGTDGTIADPADIQLEQHYNKELKQAKFCNTLYLRQTPFPNPIDDVSAEQQKLWDKIPTAIIQPEDIASYDMGKDDNEVLNWFWVHSMFLPVDASKQKAAAAKPIIHRNSIRTYGLKIFEVATRTAGLTGNTENDIDSGIYLASLQKLTQLIAGWYFRNQEFYNGSLTVKGSHEYHIGDRIKFPIKDEVFTGYIEGVVQSFVNFGNWTTTVQVSRADSDNIDLKVKLDFASLTELKQFQDDTGLPTQ